MTETITAGGLLTEKDVKRLASRSRGGSVGPTTVYYAGVTGPAISAGIAVVSRHALHMIGMSTYWQMLLSAIIAACAGITWYVIFIRWSYRHKFGRGTETTNATEIAASPECLTIVRGDIETRIRWSAVSQIEISGKYTIITVKGANAIIVPARWFDGDERAELRFQDSVTAWATDVTVIAKPKASPASTLAALAPWRANEMQASNV